MHYRFPVALIASFELAAADAPRLAELRAAQNDRGSGPHARLFLHLATPSLYAALSKQLKQARLRLTSPASPADAATMVRYLSPHVVLAEARLCAGQDGASFREMLAALPAKTAIFVLGALPDAETVELYRIAEGHDLYFVAHLDAKLAARVRMSLSALAGVRAGEKSADTSYVTAESPYSYARLIVPAQLIELHPHQASISCNYFIEPFSLVQLQAPFIKRWLGKYTWIKLTEVPKAADGLQAAPWRIKALLADLSEHERRDLVSMLGRLPRAAGPSKDDPLPFDADAGLPAFLKAPSFELGLLHEPWLESHPLTLATFPLHDERLDDSAVGDALLSSRHQEWAWLVLMLGGVALLVMLLLVLYLLAGRTGLPAD